MAVWWIDDLRRTGFELQSIIEPEFVVVAASGPRRLVFFRVPEKREKQRIAGRMITVTTEQARSALFQYRQLSVREKFLACELLRSLEWRHGVVDPDALKIRMSIWRSWSSPTCRGSRSWWRFSTRRLMRRDRRDCRCNESDSDHAGS